MLKFNSIDEAFEYKGTDEVVININDVEWRCKRHINPNGSLGGYVDSTSSIDDTCYIGENCIIFNNVHLKNYVDIYDNVVIFNYVNISDNVDITNVVIYGGVDICSDVEIHDCTSIYNNVKIRGPVEINKTRDISHGSYITRQEDFMIINNIGSRNDTITFTKNKEGIVLVHTGCFNGTEEEFIEAIKEKHGDNTHGKIYMNLLETFKLRQML